MPQLAYRRDDRVGARHLLESVLVQRRAPGVEQRPRDAEPNQQRLKPLFAERRSFVDAEILVDLSNQPLFDSVPVLHEQPVRRQIDRRAGVLYRRQIRHVTAAEERAGQVDERDHRRQEACKSVDVGIAILDDLLLLFIGPRRAAQN